MNGPRDVGEGYCSQGHGTVYNDLLDLCISEGLGQYFQLTAEYHRALEPPEIINTYYGVCRLRSRIGFSIQSSYCTP